MTVLASPPVDERREFRHEAHLYHGDEGFLTGTIPFIRDGLEAGDPVLVAAVAPKVDLLRDVLGQEAVHVGFVDLGRAGRNPARIIPLWQEFVDRHADHPGPIRGIGEPVWPGRSPAALVECHHHEVLLDLAFTGGRPWWLVCPYDAAALPDEVVDRVSRSHGRVVGAPASVGNGHGLGHGHGHGHRDDPLSLMAEPLDPAPPDAPGLTFDASSLPAVRRAVAAHAEVAGLGPLAAQEYVLAVHEAATNSILHGGGAGLVRWWHDDDGAVTEVQDRGRIVDQPLLGRVLPPALELGGRGMWLINHICDLVQLRSEPTGTVVRMFKHRDG